MKKIKNDKRELKTIIDTCKKCDFENNIETPIFFNYVQFHIKYRCNKCGKMNTRTLKRTIEY